MFLLFLSSALVFGIGEFGVIEFDIFDGTVRGRVIRCIGDVCGYFECMGKSTTPDFATLCSGASKPPHGIRLRWLSG